MLNAETVMNEANKTYLKTREREGDTAKRTMTDATTEDAATPLGDRKQIRKTTRK